MKPVFYDIDRTSAVFTDSTVTYSSPTVTYSSATTQYGGSDTIVDKGPMFMNVSDIVPELQAARDIVPVMKGISES